MNNKLKQLKVETKLRFYQDVSNHYNELNCRRQSGYFHFEEIHLKKMHKI